MENPKQSLYSRSNFLSKVLLPLPDGPQKTRGRIGSIVISCTSCTISTELISSSWVISFESEHKSFVDVDWILVTETTSFTWSGGQVLENKLQTESILSEEILHVWLATGSEVELLLMRLQAIWSNLSCCWSKLTVSNLSRFLIILLLVKVVLLIKCRTHKVDHSKQQMKTKSDR